MKRKSFLQLRSKVSRRILATVLLCALLPILGLVSLTLYNVHSRLTTDTSRRLHHASKNVGMAIMAELSSIGNELQQVAALQELPTVGEQIIKSSVSLGDFDPLGDIWLFPESAAVNGFTEEIRERLGSGQPHLSIVRDETETTILIWMPVTDLHGQKGVAIGKVNLEYLWAYAQWFLPLNSQLTIVDETYRPLFINDENLFLNLDVLQEVHKERHQYAEINVAGSTWLVGHWDLFLLAGFNSPAWHIIVGEPKKYAFAGLISFQRNAGLTGLATFWVILLASSILVRKILQPLKKLKEATLEVGRGHYDFQLDIKSDDEFEVLSDSFNGMVGKIQQQIVELDDLNIGILTALARTVDANSKWTHGHSERVTEYAVTIAKELGLNEGECHDLHRAGLLHDLGKVSIPAEILNKSGKLTAEEYTLMKGHPAEGDRILEPIHAFEKIRPFIRHHHERWDGKGYPDGLKGQEIQLGARILAVADVYDALYSDRPYRDGWSQEKVVSYLKEESGTAFDPVVVQALLKSLEKTTSESV